MTMEEMRRTTEELNKHRERMQHTMTRGEVLDYLRLMREFIPNGMDPLAFAEHVFLTIKVSGEDGP